MEDKEVRMLLKEARTILTASGAQFDDGMRTIKRVQEKVLSEL